MTPDDVELAAERITGRVRRTPVIDHGPLTLKLELIFRRTFRTRREARQAIFNYIEVFYNRQRCHSYLGYLSPVEFEELAKSAEAAA